MILKHFHFERIDWSAENCANLNTSVTIQVDFRHRSDKLFIFFRQRLTDQVRKTENFNKRLLNGRQQSFVSRGNTLELQKKQERGFLEPSSKVLNYRELNLQENSMHSSWEIWAFQVWKKGSLDSYWWTCFLTLHRLRQSTPFRGALITGRPTKYLETHYCKQKQLCSL